VSQAAALAARAGHPLPAPKPGATVPAAILDHALAVGISRGFLVASGIALLALIITIATIRVRRADLAGAQSAVEVPAIKAPAVTGTRERTGILAAGDGLASAEEPIGP
jgi:hypothetical protein